MMEANSSFHTGFRLYAVFLVLALSVLVVGLVRLQPFSFPNPRLSVISIIVARGNPRTDKSLSWNRMLALLPQRTQRSPTTSSPSQMSAGTAQYCKRSLFGTPVTAGSRH